ncbi:MAG: DUF1574 domain-containing protein [Spirochaetia bacterium]|nr:DUF1574 domain-containing protein [Spirochaetia bacterium]
MKKVYFPVLIALIVFAVDKVALIPAFRQCCTTAPSASMYRLSLNSDFRQDELVAQARRESKRIMMTFGSSRSLGYFSGPSIEQIESSQYISAEQKKKLKSWDVINSAAPGASIVTEYVRMIQWLDHGVKPDLLAIEFSRFSLNANSLWHDEEIKNGIPLDFVLKNILSMPRGHSATVIGSRVFALSRYRIGAPSAVSAPIWEGLFNKLTDQLATRQHGSPVGPGVRVGQEDPLALATYRHVASEMNRTMFQGYRPDPDMTKYAFLMVERAKRDGIPIVLWNPAAHPIWNAVEEAADPRNRFARVVRDLKRGGGIYLDLNLTGAMKCDEFSDPVHSHQNCFPELAIRTIEAGGF